MAKAKVFKSGNSQAVRLPKDFRFDTNEVEIIRRKGEVVLKRRTNNLSDVFNILTSLSSDFMKGERKQPRPQKRNFPE